MNHSLYWNILWLVILGILSQCCTKSIFFSRQDANRVLKIHKRANNLMEELRPGNLERECYEEKCDLEEANEIFETREQTLNFWSVYFDGDQCLSNPCINGDCKDGIGRFDCICPRGWEGKLCSHEVEHFNCSVNNGGCTHFCIEKENSTFRICSCALGYKLDEDFRSCKPAVEFPCGKMKIFNSDYSARLTGAKKGRKGDSPWQLGLYYGPLLPMTGCANGNCPLSGGRFVCCAGISWLHGASLEVVSEWTVGDPETGSTMGAGLVLLLNDMKFQCGGVLIHPSWVLTAAHCLKQPGKYVVRLGEYDRRCLEDTEQQILVNKIIIHPKFNAETVDNDIALLHLNQPAVYNKYVLPICLPSYGLAERNLTLEGTETIVTGWGNQDETQRNRSQILSYIQIPIVPHQNCSKVMQNRITNNMLCAGRLGDNQDACSGDSGGPMITQFGDTWFLIGLVSWGEGCGRLDNFGVYTRVNNYLHWIREQMTNYGTEEKKAKSRPAKSRQT